MFEDRFERVQISRNRVHGGLTAIATGLNVAALGLDLLYLATGSGGAYDAAWFTLLVGTSFLAAAIVPGIVAWIEESRHAAAYMTRADDGRAVVLASAMAVGVLGLVLRAGQGAVIGPELGVAVAFAIGGLGLLAFAGPLGDGLADRFPSSRRTTASANADDLAGRRETKLRR
jgi:uncharacterized membrane protein